MSNSVIYTENVSSKRTEFLFIALTILFFLLLIWRAISSSLDILAGVFLFFFCFFLFYSLNYRTLMICLTSDALKLSFGIFRSIVPLNNIGECSLDDIPAVMRMGGAGIHFMVIRNRYRASFNFLEHSRVVIGLKRKVGLVRDISFSTRQPEELLQLIQGARSAIKST